MFHVLGLRVEGIGSRLQGICIVVQDQGLKVQGQG